MYDKNNKILIINSDFSPSGGAEWIAYKTYRALKNRGHNTFFFASDRKPYFEEDYEYIPFFTKFIGSTKEYLKNPFRYYFNTKARKDFENFINKIKPDIIHLHSFRVTMTSSILEVCKDIPTVMTVHDPGIVCPAATMMYKGQNLCTNKQCMQGRYIDCLRNRCSNGAFEPSLRKTVRAYIFKNQYQKYIDKFITPSNALKNIIVNASISIKESDIITVPNFLDNNERSTSPNYQNQGYFLYIGRLNKDKNVISLLKAIKELPKDIKLHIAGNGSEENTLKDYAKQNNLKNVSFLGFINREQAKQEYQNCIATILPCNWFEIFGMTNIESFLNGKPVIASNIGGIPELVEHNKTGLLFEPNNIEQLKDCILEYWNNPELVIEHGRNGYEKVKDNYTEDEYYNSIISVYEQIANNT